MTNRYYNNTTTLNAFSKARAADVEAKTAAIATGFDAVQTEMDAKAPLASPTFTGTPRAPTAASGSSGTQVATLDFVNATAMSAALPGQTGNAGKFLTSDGTNASWGRIPPATGSTLFLASNYGGF